MSDAAVALPDANQQVSHEHDGRVLTGMGVSAEALAEVVERQAPESSADAAISSDTAAADDASSETAQPSTQADRNPDGTFKKPSRGAKRFDELTREREEANRRADAAEAKARALEARLSQPPTKPEPVREVAPPPDSATQTRPKPTEDEVGTKYPAYADFVEDLADWKAEQRLAQIDFDARIRTSIEADRASRGFASQVQDTYTKARQSYPDFDAVLAANTTPFPVALAPRILALPKAEHVLYALAKDPAALARIGTMTDPFEQGLALAQLIPPDGVASTASTRPVVRPTQAPAPIQPVGTGSKTTSPPLEELAASGDYDAYKQRRQSELRGATRR